MWKWPFCRHSYDWGKKTQYSIFLIFGKLKWNSKYIVLSSICTALRQFYWRFEFRLIQWMLGQIMDLHLHLQIGLHHLKEVFLELPMSILIIQPVHSIIQKNQVCQQLQSLLSSRFVFNNNIMSSNDIKKLFKIQFWHI